jgi:FAD/FMN-containing dehydrogenase
MTAQVQRSTPDAVICPQTTEDVVIAVNIAYIYGIPVTVGGGLTGMAGGAVPIHGGIYIDSTTIFSQIVSEPANPGAIIDYFKEE